LTGGQNVAHEPLQFDVVEVSGANQYRVKPWALVSTAAPLIVVVFSALLLDAGAPEAPAAGGVLLVELPHAAIIKAAAASPAGASHVLFITCSPICSGVRSLNPDM
jgi:hypothetical protein